MAEDFAIFANNVIYWLSDIIMHQDSVHSAALREEKTLLAEEEVLHLLEFGGAARLAAAGNCTVEDITAGVGNATGQDLTLVLDLYHLHRGLVILLFHNSFLFVSHRNIFFYTRAEY